MDDTLWWGLQDGGARRPAPGEEGVRFVVRLRVLLLCAAAAGVAAGCAESTPPAAAERGRRVYLANCITCHNPDPTKAGASGPEIAGASRELVEARVIHGTYPAGYTPKRPTQAMVALPHLASRIDDLAAFLAAAHQ